MIYSNELGETKLSGVKKKIKRRAQSFFFLYVQKNKNNKQLEIKMGNA